MATALAGKGGSLYIPGTPNVPIASIQSWDLSIDAENYDATVLGDDWKEFVAGLRGWNGSATGFYNIVTDTTGQRQLYNALLNGTTLALQMQTAAGGGMFEGLTNITNCAIADPVNGLITIKFTFVGNGSLQHNP